jgi:hypothetical protein
MGDGGVELAQPQPAPPSTAPAPSPPAALPGAGVAPAGLSNAAALRAAQPAAGGQQSLGGQAARPPGEDESKIVDAKEYEARFANEIGDGVVAVLGALPLGTGTRYVGFTAPMPLGVAIVDARGEALTRLIRGWLAPDQLDTLVNSARIKSRVRVTDERTTWVEEQQGMGPARWFPEVAIVVGQAVGTLVHQSLARIVPRYVDAAVAVGLEEEERRRQSLLEVPRPLETDIVPSHPIDRRTIAALVRFATFDYQGYRAANPEERGRLGVLRPVRFAWEPQSTGRFWIRVSSPPDPTVEEVAAALFGSPAHAGEVTVAAAPLFGISNPNLLLEAHRQRLTELGVEPRWLADPLHEALQGPLAEEIAKQQVADVKPTAVTRSDVARTIDQSLAILDRLAASGARFGMGKGPYVESVEPLRKRLKDRRDRLLAGTNRDALAWAAQAEAQRDILSDISFGLDRHVHLLDSLTKLVKDATAKLGGFNLPDYSREAMLRVAMRYADAAVASELPRTAATLLAKAQDEASELPVVFLEGALDSIQRIADEARHAKRTDGSAWESYDVEQMRRREEQYRIRLARIRILLRTDPTAAATELAEVQKLILDLQVESELVGNMDQIDATWQALEDSLSFWFSTLGTRIRVRWLQQEADKWHGRWKRIHETWKAGDQAAKERAKTDLDHLRADPELRAFFGRVQEAVKDAQTEVLIGKLVAMLVITVITAGVGDIVLAGAVGWELSAGATAVLVGGAEAATFTVLSQVFLEEDHSLGHIAYEFGTNWAMFGALRRFAMFAEVAELGVVAKYGGQAVLLGALTFAKADLDTYIRHGRHLTREEAKTIALQGVAMYIAMHAVAPLAKPLFAELEGSAYAFTSKLRANNRTQQALKATIEALKGTRDFKTAREYVAAERAWLEERIGIIGEIEAQAAKEAATTVRGRGVTAKIKMSQGDLASLKAELQSHLETVSKAELPLLTLEPKAPGLFTCPREHIGQVVKALGEQLDVTEDPKTRVRTYTVKTPDGTVVKVMEQVDPLTQWLAELKSSLTPEQLARLELWTGGKSPQEIHDLFGGDIEAAKAQLSAPAGMTADAAARRAALTGRAQEMFDARWKAIVGDKVTPSRVTRFLEAMDALARRESGDLQKALDAEWARVNAPKPTRPPSGPGAAELPRLRAAAEALVKEIKDFIKANPGRLKGLEGVAKGQQRDIDGALADMETGAKEATPARIEGFENNLKGFRAEFEAATQAPPGTEIGAVRDGFEIDQISPDQKRWTNIKQWNLFSESDPRMADLIEQAKSNLETAAKHPADDGTIPEIVFDFKNGVTPEVADRLGAVEVDGRHPTVLGERKARP